MREYKEVKKRVLACMLAVVTVITTWSTDLTALAASYSGVGQEGGWTITDAGQLAEIYTAQSTYEQLQDASFKMYVQEGSSVGYKVSVYQNLTDTSNPTSGVNVYTSPAQTLVGDGSDAQTVTFDFVGNSANINFAADETYAIVITFTQTGSGSVMYYEGGANTNGFRKNRSSDGVWEANRGNMIQSNTTAVAAVDDIDSITLSSDRVICMALNGDPQTLTATLSPAYRRQVYFNQGGNPVVGLTRTAYNQVSMQPMNTGIEVLSVSTTEGDLSYQTEMQVRVIDAQIATSSYEYTGTAIEPEVTFQSGDQTFTAEDIGATVEYSDNVDVGTGKISITSSTAFSGYTDELTFEITGKEITQEQVDEAAFSIDGSTSQVTAATLGGLTLGRDFTATAVRTGTTASTITYEITVTGIGNYTGEATTTYVVTAQAGGTLIDISDVVTATLNTTRYTYDTRQKEPGITFKAMDGSVISDFASNCLISYSNNTNAGTGTVTITGNSERGYTGTITKNFTITRCSIKSANVSITLQGGTDGSYPHTGSAVEPEIVVRLQTETPGVYYDLVQNTDYTLVYSNNEEIGTANVKINGINNFSGNLTKYYEIVGDFEKDTIVDVDTATTDYSMGYVSDYETPYTGSAIEPEIYVSMGNASLNPGDDYTVEYQNNVNAGQASVVITGQGEYAGKSITVTFTITPITINRSLILTNGDKIYTGSAITLDSSEYAINGLTENVDYTIGYSNNTNAGTATITATGTGNYTGSVSGRFTISPRVINDSLITVAPIPDQIYTGSALRPAVTVQYNGVTLPTSSYSLAYGSNTAIGTATVTITGKGNLTGSRVETFVIKAKTMDSLTFTVEGTSVSAGTGNNLVSGFDTPYSGMEQKPSIRVMDGSTTLTAFRDYTVGYGNNINCGTANIYVMGNGAYAGSMVTITFTISPKDIASTDISVAYSGDNYKSGEYTLPNVVVTDAGAVVGRQTLSRGTGYIITGTEGSKTSGTGKIATITGIGNYTGTREVEYTIGYDISDTAKATIGLTNPYDNTAYTLQDNGKYYVTYMGNEATPKAAITYDGATLTSADYDISYTTTTEANGTDIYTAANDNTIQVVITGKGDYYGSVTLQYTIVEAPFTSIGKFTVTNPLTGDSTFNYTYDNETKTVNTDVKYILSADKSILLQEGVDYTLTPKTIGPDAGDTTITITGSGNYQGIMTVNATINKTSLADTSRITAGEIPTQEYTGYPIIPPYTLVDQTTGETLMRDEDFTVEFQNNVSVGTGKVIVTGINNYTGTRTIEFGIVARSLATNRITITPIDDQVYNGTALTPGFTVYYGPTPLTRGVDYECVYTNNTAPGQAVITITGMGTYSGQNTANFNIIGDISDTSLFTLNGVSDSYNLVGGALNFNGDTVTLKYAENTTLLSSSNYRIVQENCTTPGMGRITFIGQNYCTGARSVNVKVIGNLNEAVVADVRAGYDYTGNKISPVPKVTYGDNVLILGRDYTLTYGDNTTAGVGNGTITIQPVDGSYYTGSQVAYFDIQYNLDNAIVEGPQASYRYTGSAIHPAVDVVTVNGKTLSSSEYTVSYGENINAGTGQITITPNCGYAIGSKTIRFNIEGISLMDAQISVENQANYTTNYTGNEIRPNVTVTYLGRPLTLGTDYTVTYNNNIAAGTGEIRVLGTGNYTGAVDKTFTITQKDVSAIDVTAVISSAGYAGGQPVTPDITLIYNGITLQKDVDYTYVVSNNTNVTNSAVVTFTGIGNFTGRKTSYFEVTQTDLSRGTVTVDAATAVYTGQPADPHIRVSCPVGNGEYYTLQEGRDYNVTYGTALAQMINVDSYMIRITGVGNFINSLNTTYTITAKPVNAADITVDVEDMDYTGSAVVPNVVVTDTTRGVELVKGVDYSIGYSNNTNSASAIGENAPTVTITGMGNYGETVDKTFNIGESMQSARVVLDQDTYTYDRTAHVPTEVVTLDGTTLTKDVDYTVTYMEDVTNAGNKTVTIQGMGQYYGTIVSNYVINKKIANSSSIVLRLNLPTDEDGNYIVTYTGAPVEPEVFVYDEEISAEVPLRTEDYTIEYKNNNIVGTVLNPAYAVVSLRGNYDAGADTYRVPFIIEERSITDDFNIRMDSYRYQYTGEAILPNVTVTSNVNGTEVILSPDTDYDMVIENNVNAGRATITVTGKGNYSGEVTSSFDIYASLATAQVTIDRQFYTGEAVQPPVSVICGGNELVAGVDYNVAYYSDDNYTTGGYVIITPLTSYYSDSVTQTYEIGFDPELLQVRNYANEYTYTGDEIKPTFIISTPSGTYLPYNAIDVTYEDQNGGSDCTNVGTVTASIPLTAGENTITLEATYTIIPRNINTCDIMQLENNTYTGKALTPPAIVQYRGDELTNQDYQVSYSNNVNPGVADAAVIGRGNFTGVKTLHFNIVSASMINLKAAPASDTSIALTWTRHQHVTGYQIYSGDSNTLYGTTTGNSFTVGGLQSGTEYALKVRSYVTVNGVTTFGAFKSVNMLTNVASTSITVRSLSRGRATINWSAAADVSGYEIYRSNSANGTYSKIAVMPKSAGGYTDSGLTSGQTYYYKVRAYKSVNGSYVYGAYSVGTATTVK